MRRFRELWNDERGQVLIMTFFSMMVLMGFMAFAVDVGVLFRARRNMQIAADAGAMAGAAEQFNGGTTSQVQSAVYAAAAANGVDNTVTGNTVTVTGPGVTLASGATCASCVEVQVGTPNPTFFMNLFTQTQTTNVAAMAVAGAPGNSKNCVWLMDPSLSDELDMQGAGAVNATNCSIYVNSNQSDAVKWNNGHPGNIAASNLEIVGNDAAAKSALTGTNVQINVAAQTPTIPTDLSGIPSSGCTGTAVTATEIIHGGTPGKNQATDTSVSGSSTNNVVCFTNKSGVTLDSGVVLGGVSGSGVIYVFEYGVTLNGAAQFGCYGTQTPCSANPPQSDGTFLASETFGATLDIDGGGISQGNNQLTIFAPTSGTYNSIALMQPTSNPNDAKCPANKSPDPCLLIQKGSSNSTFDGIIYAPGEDLEIQDGGGGVAATGVEAAGLYAKGSGTLNISGYTNANPNTSPFKLVTMVE